MFHLFCLENQFFLVKGERCILRVLPSIKWGVSFSSGYLLFSVYKAIVLVTNSWKVVH